MPRSGKLAAPLNICKILVPVDLSANSQRAVDYATDLAQKYNSSLLVLHVIPIGEFVRAMGTFGPDFPEPVQKQIDTLKSQSYAWLEKIKKSAESLGVKVSIDVHVSTNSIVKSITDHADRQNVDIVIMGTRGETDVSKMLIGSVASGVLNSLDKTITVVK